MESKSESFKSSDFADAKDKLVEYIFENKIKLGILESMLKKVGLTCSSKREPTIEPNWDNLSGNNNIIENFCDILEALHALKNGDNKYHKSIENAMSPASALEKACKEKKMISNDSFIDILFELRKRGENLLSGCKHFIAKFKKENIVNIHALLIKKSKEDLSTGGCTPIFVFSAKFLSDCLYKTYENEKILCISGGFISNLKSSFKDTTDIDCVYGFFYNLDAFCKHPSAEKHQKQRTYQIKKNRNKTQERETKLTIRAIAHIIIL